MLRPRTRCVAPLQYTAVWMTTALVLGAPAVAFSQAPPGGELIRVIEMTLRPDRVGDGTRLQQEELIPAQLEGGYPWVDVWRAGGAGNPYFRSVVVPMNGLEELDEASVFAEALGPERADALLQQHRELVTGINTRIVRPRPDLGFGTRAPTPDVGVLVTVTVASGRVQEFEERMRESVVPELRGSNVASLAVGEILFGGQGNQYFTLMFFENFETVAQGHPTALSWVMGSNGVVRVADEPNSPIVAFERTILRYDPALSAGNRTFE